MQSVYANHAITNLINGLILGLFFSQQIFRFLSTLRRKIAKLDNKLELVAQCPHRNYIEITRCTMVKLKREQLGVYIVQQWLSLICINLIGSEILRTARHCEGWLWKILRNRSNGMDTQLLLFGEHSTFLEVLELRMRWKKSKSINSVNYKIYTLPLLFPKLRSRISLRPIPIMAIKEIQKEIVKMMKTSQNYLESEESRRSHHQTLAPHEPHDKIRKLNTKCQTRSGVLILKNG